MIPVAILVTIINFGLLRMAPGDPVLAYAGEVRDPEILNEMPTSSGSTSPCQSSIWRGCSTSRRGTSVDPSAPTRK
jgi:peptide/nickel transport system permease protein